MNIQYQYQYNHVRRNCGRSLARMVCYSCPWYFRSSFTWKTSVLAGSVVRHQETLPQTCIANPPVISQQPTHKEESHRSSLGPPKLPWRNTSKHSTWHKLRTGWSVDKIGQALLIIYIHLLTFSIKTKVTFGSRCMEVQEKRCSLIWYIHIIHI